LVAIENSDSLRSLKVEEGELDLEGSQRAASNFNIILAELLLLNTIAVMRQIQNIFEGLFCENWS